MINDFIDKMKPDFSNIDEVYSELLIKANVNNIDFTEVMFIDSFDFKKYDGIENLNLKLAKISMYLAKKRNKVNWFDIDYYNHYLQTKRFGFNIIKEYKLNEEDELIETINIYKHRFNFIFSKLPNVEEKEKFKSRQLQSLKSLKNKQTDDYFKSKFKDLITAIKSVNKENNNNSSVNIKINNGIDIIDVILIQLDAIIKLFKKDINAKESRFIYYIHEKEVTFLDDKLLKQYLAKTKVENLAFLQEVLKKVDLIIKFFKIDLDSIPIKEFEFEQYYKTKKTKKYDIRTYQDFYILVLCNDKAVTINNESLKIDFFKETDYTEHSHVSIYRCCKTIRELITTAYPELDNKIEVDKPLNQTEITTNKNNSKELHNHIFVNNAFEVWQSMFDEFNIKESKRSDVKFMFEMMKKEKMIFDTVTQESFLKWITETYDGMIIERTSNINKTNTRMNAFNRAKELYKY